MRAAFYPAGSIKRREFQVDAWYYGDAEGQRHGPVSARDMERLFHSGAVGLDTPIWRDGMSRWQPLRDHAGEFAFDRMERGVTLDLRPVHSQVADPRATHAVSADGRAPPTVPVTGRTRRQAGRVVYGWSTRVSGNGRRRPMIDSLIIGIIVGIVGGLLTGFTGGISSRRAVSAALNLILPLNVFVSFAYYTWFHASEWQATPGKMAIGIKVTTGEGERITLLHGIARYLAVMLSRLTFGFGFVMASFTRRKQTLHDIVCDTLVVDKWAFTDHPRRQRQELGTLAVMILMICAALLLLLVGGVFVHL